MIRIFLSSALNMIFALSLLFIYYNATDPLAVRIALVKLYLFVA